MPLLDPDFDLAMTCFTHMLYPRFMILSIGLFFGLFARDIAELPSKHAIFIRRPLRPAGVTLSFQEMSATKMVGGPPRSICSTADLTACGILPHYKVGLSYPCTRSFILGAPIPRTVAPRIVSMDRGSIRMPNHFRDTPLHYIGIVIYRACASEPSFKLFGPDL
jgi:hypothetical protein